MWRVACWGHMGSRAAAHLQGLLQQRHSDPALGKQEKGARAGFADSTDRTADPLQIPSTQLQTPLEPQQAPPPPHLECRLFDAQQPAACCR